MKAVILAGGYGKRLKPLTDEKPKAMIEVLNRPIVEWQINWLKNNRIDDIVLCVGYLKDHIVNYIGTGSKQGVNVYYMVEDEPLGTGGALKNTETLLSNEESFFMVNGDVLTNINPMHLKEKLTNDLVATIAVVPLPSPFGIVEIGNNSKVLGFKEKPKITQFWINAGVYYFSKKIFNYLPKNGSMERTAFPALAQHKKLKAIKYENTFWRSIDSHKDIEEASAEMGTLSKEASLIR
ncbi:MAG: NDP-sugar synthase [Nitrososphaerales archaeon]